jgi:phenylalanyl-tRNA synthetase alpha subunit
MSSEAVDYDAQVEAVREAFEREFGRFARFLEGGAEGLALAEAESHLRELAELRTRHTSKKSALSQLMKLIGRVPAEERAAFGQRVQALNAEVAARLDAAQAALDGLKAALAKK